MAPEYWILEPHEERMEILALHDGLYTRASAAGRGHVVTSFAVPGFTCEVEALSPW